MKKNGLAFFIISLVIVLLGVLGILLLKFYKPTVDKELIASYGVISKSNINIDKIDFYQRSNRYFVATKNNMCGIIDNEGNALLDYKYEECVATGNSFVTFGNNTYTIYDLKGNAILESKEKIEFKEDLFNDKNIYYFVEDNGNTIVYDSKANYVYTLNSTDLFAIMDNFLIVNGKAINLSTTEEISFKEREILGKYIYFKLSDSYLVYNTENKDSVYYNNLEYNGYSYVFSDNTDNIILDKDGNILNDSNNYQINDDYLLDYSLCDNEMFKVKNKSDELISDNCYSKIESAFEKNESLLLFNEQKNIFELLLSNSQIKSLNSDDVYIVGEYLYVFNESLNMYELYNFSGEKLNNVCSENMVEIANGKYICRDKFSTYLIDKELKKITGEYFDIICNDNNACVIKDFDGKYGLMINEKVLIEPRYYSGNIEDNYVMFESLQGYEIVELGLGLSTLSKENLVDEDYIEYSTIEIDNVIEEYSLNDKEIIYDNKELFQKYAYVILTNKKVNGYRKELLSMFDVIIDNKQYLDTNYFLFNLSKLSIDKIDSNSNYYGGTYDDQFKRINLFSNDKSIIKHEFMHFIDHNINKDDESIVICDNNYYFGKDILEINKQVSNNCEKTNKYEYDIIIEAGTEFYSSKYNRFPVVSYKDAVLIYNAFNIIFGEEFMNEVYFSKNGTYKLYSELLKYIDNDAYTEFLNSSSRLIFDNVVDMEKNKEYVFYTLINLYKNKQGGNWYDNKEFLFLMSLLVQNIEFNGLYVQKNDYDKLLNAFDISEEIVKKAGNYSLASSSVGMVKINDDSLIYFNIYKEAEKKVLEVSFDFESWSIKESKIVN